MVREGRPYYRAAGRGGRGRFRGSRNFRPRRQNYDSRRDPVENWNTNLRKMFNLVGDFSGRNENSQPLVQNVLSIITALDSQGIFSDSEQTNNLADMTIKAAGCLGMQAPVYALITSLCSGKGHFENDFTFGNIVVEGVCMSLVQSMQVGAFIRSKLLLRFLGELVSCHLVRPSEFGDLLTSIVSHYVAKQHFSQTCTDMLAFIVISALPWCGPILHSSWVSGFSSLIDQLHVYMERRQPVFANRGLRGIFHSSDESEDDKASDEGKNIKGENILQSNSSADSLGDSLEVMWSTVIELNETGWPELNDADSVKCSSICRPYRDPEIAKQLESVTEISLPDDLIGPNILPDNLVNISTFAALHSMRMTEDGKLEVHPPFSISPLHSLSYAYAFCIHFEYDIFHEDVGGAAAQISKLPKLSKAVLKEYIKDVIAAFQPIIKEDGISIGKYETMSAQLLSIGQLIPEREAIAPYLVIEVLMQMIMSLPQVPHMAALLHRTVLELCRSSPEQVAHAVSSATGVLFQEIPRMDAVSARQLANWFANHLKDTEYKWPFWSHWEFVCDEPADSPQRLFVSTVLDSLVRLSYKERIQKDLPDALWSLLPPSQSIQCPFTSPKEESFKNIAVQLTGKIRSKEDAYSVESWLKSELNEIVPEEDTKELQQHPYSTAQAITYAILHAGSPSPTHLLQAVERYGDLLRLRVSVEKNSQDVQMGILQAITASWKNSSQQITSTVSLFAMTGIVYPESIVSFFFHQENMDVLAFTPHLWDMVEAVIKIIVDAAEKQEEKIDDHDENDMEDEEHPTGRKAAFDSLQSIANAALRGFAKSLHAAENQYASSNFSNLYEDPWWVAMTSYFKSAVRRLFCCSEIFSVESYCESMQGAVAEGLNGTPKVRELFEAAEAARKELLAMVREVPSKPWGSSLLPGEAAC